MNLRGSYRALRDNSKSAMLACIEIYNKPSFQYRNETFIILLLNSWELLFKAILSKNKKSIYYKKEKNKPYRTYSLVDAIRKCENLFPPDIPFEPVESNINLLKIYRDNAVHFYNSHDLDSIIYDLAQTSIINYKDLIQACFDVDLTEEIGINLLPLAFRPPLEPIKSLNSKNTKGKQAAIDEFRRQLSSSIESLEMSAIDSSRLMTTYNIKLESVKKASSADFVVGVKSEEEADDDSLLMIERKIDPNKNYPLTQNLILEKLSEVDGIQLTSYVFQAIIRKYNLKNKQQYCWIDKHTDRPYYSNETIRFLKNLTKSEIVEARNQYKQYRKERRKQAV